MELIARDICKRFGEKEVLRGASFTFEKGRIYGLLGRNGAGKTTLFNCMNEDVKADGGSFEIAGDDGRRRPFVPEDIGYVLCTPVVPEFLTGYEFVKFFLEITGDPGRTGRTPDDWLALVGIEADDRHRLMRGYSHGMKNKVQMLCFLIGRPPVILLDEPLTSLDVVVAEEMKELLRHQKAGRVTIFSTHLMDLALDLCDEIVLLSHGVLSRVDKADLDEEGFKEKIIAALQAEEPQGAQEAGHE